MKFINWLWTDDKTGKFSDTTLRTWLLFFLFFALTIYFVFMDTQILPEELSLMNIIAIACLGQGGLYLGNRINERTSQRFPLPDNFLEKIRTSKEESIGAVKL